ncbi:MAG: MFS transporter [Alphaproteobacteria bacterium]|nr:MFS transporter [Alphaproteobacteria bacterium]
MADPGSSAAFRTLQIPNFRNFMIGNFFSQAGMWVQRIAVGWLTWELTKNATWLGAMAMADFFPNIIFAPLAGALADRMDRLKAVRLYVTISAVISTAIVWLTITDQITVHLLLVLVLMNGIAMSFNYPVRLSLIHSLVGREALTSAVSINAIVFNIARIGGPALGGPAIAFWGVGPVLVFTVIADLVFVFTLYKVQLLSKTKKAAKEATTLGTEIMDGFRYAYNHAGIGRLLIILIMMAVFGRSFIELLPAFAEKIFNGNVNEFAWFTSTLGIGSFIGSISLAKREGVEGLTRILVFNTLILSLATIGFAATDNFWIALVFMLAVGYAIVAIGVIEQTLIQVAVDDSMRGRMLSFYTLIARGFPSIGALLMGWLSTFHGLQQPIIAGAVICIGVWAWSRHRLKMLEESLEVYPDEKKENQ